MKESVKFVCDVLIMDFLCSWCYITAKTLNKLPPPIYFTGMGPAVIAIPLNTEGQAKKPLVTPSNIHRCD